MSVSADLGAARPADAPIGAPIAAPRPPRGRRADLDRVKGLAILLVVFGHIVARQDPAHVHWYEPVRRAIYAFHMPLFFYLSGYVTWLTGQAQAPPAAWPALLRRRAHRLLLPFAAMGLLIILGKLAAGTVMHVDNEPAGMASGLADLLWHTRSSPAGSLWYLATLFALAVATPPLLALFRFRLAPLLGLFLLLYLLPAPPALYADRIATYAIFFGMGLAAAAAGPRWLAAIDRHRRPACAVFCLLLIAAAALPAWPEPTRLLLVGAVSMPALHGLLRHRRLASERILTTLGRYSLMIYLFNTIFIGLAKGLMLHVESWNGPHFLLFAWVLTAAGVLGPLALKRYGLRAVPALDRLTD